MSVYLRREVDTKESSLIRRLINKAGCGRRTAFAARKRTKTYLCPYNLANTLESLKAVIMSVKP